MGKLVFILLLGWLGWYCHTNGIIYSLTHNLEPEIGRKCDIAGPIKEGVYFSLDKEDMRYPIDAQIGTAGQKMDARLLLAKAIRQEKIFQIPDHTKVLVLDNSTITLYSVKYHLVHVSLASGEATGAKGWIERADLIDTPLQEFYQSMRGVSRKDTSTPTPAGDSGSGASGAYSYGNE